MTGGQLVLAEEADDRLGVLVRLREDRVPTCTRIWSFVYSVVSWPTLRSRIADSDAVRLTDATLSLFSSSCSRTIVAPSCARWASTVCRALSIWPIESSDASEPFE